MRITDIQGKVRLHNEVEMPYFGLGVFEANEGPEVIQAIHWALEAGYRHIDTASLYGNEASVGEAIKTSGLKREEIFVTTKVWNSEQGYKNTLEAFTRSLEKLDSEYVDLYLVHWPVADRYLDTWEALEEIYERKLTRAIGVSNFNRHHIEEILKKGSQRPVVNQVEFHPGLSQQSLLKYCQDQHIQLQAWMPILKGRVNDIPLLAKIGEKYGKTAVQVALRWELQKGVVTIPKSVRRDRIISNADIFDFELSPEDIKKIDSLDKGYRLGADPDNFDF
jgi:diketogulonate reductase-like aldo/keto reductase